MGGNETQLLVVFPLSLGPCMAPTVPVSTKCSWTMQKDAGTGKNAARIAKTSVSLFASQDRSERD
jgi:hypothetical protein